VKNGKGFQTQVQKQYPLPIFLMKEVAMPHVPFLIESGIYMEIRYESA
jgi:hypothetical protein